MLYRREMRQEWGMGMLLGAAILNVIREEVAFVQDLKMMRE